MNILGTFSRGARSSKQRGGLVVQGGSSSLCCPQEKRGPHSHLGRLARNEVYWVIVSGLGGGPRGCSAEDIGE